MDNKNIFNKAANIGISHLPIEDSLLEEIQFGRGGELSQLELFDKTDNGVVIDVLEKKLRMKYDNVALKEIHELKDDTVQQRQALINWITNEDNQVKVIIAFSGGKDSIAMVLYCLDTLKIPKERIELWHHDIDGGGEQLFDWACTPSYCEAFAEALGLRLLTSYSNGGILREMYRVNETRQPIFFQKEPNGPYIELKSRGWDRDKGTRLKFPSVSADLTTRWCSAVAKIDVMRKVINNWDKYDNCNMVVMTGERRQESKNRSKYNEIEKSSNDTQSRNSIQWRPIIDWSEKQVWDIIEKHKIQPHPCYMLGWGRCSCQLCIFSSASTWASINDISPQKVSRIAEIEQDLKQKSEELIAMEEKDPSLMRKKVDAEGNIVSVPFQSIPYLYGDKIKEEQVKEAYSETKDGKTRNYKEKTVKVWTGKRKDIFESKVILGKSFVSEEMKKRWVNEATNRFVSPIFVDKWQLPEGAFSSENSGAD